MAQLPFWKRDKRRKEEELLKEPFNLRLTKTEIEFIRTQAKEECTSQNSPRNSSSNK